MRDLDDVLSRIFISAQSRNLLKTLELFDMNMQQAPQNLEPLGFTGKILFSKNLAYDAMTRCYAEQPLSAHRVLILPKNLQVTFTMRAYSFLYHVGSIEGCRDNRRGIRGFVHNH